MESVVEWPKLPDSATNQWWDLGSHLAAIILDLVLSATWKIKDSIVSKNPSSFKSSILPTIIKIFPREELGYLKNKQGFNEYLGSQLTWLLILISRQTRCLQESAYLQTQLAQHPSLCYRNKMAISNLANKIWLSSDENMFHYDQY